MKIYMILIMWMLAVIFAYSLNGCKTPDRVSIPSVESVLPKPVNDLSWPLFAAGLVKENLDKFNKAKDIKEWCPKYELLSDDVKARVWGVMVGAIIEPESGFKPETSYDESSGEASIGLMQLSYGNKFCPKSKAEGDLMNPYVNLKCGVQLMARFVEMDGVVAEGGYVQYGSQPAKGLARYWSVMREPDSKSKHHKESIRKTIKQLVVCG